MRVVGILLVGLLALFVIKSIVSWIVSLVITVLVVGAGVMLITSLLGRKASR